MIPTYGKILVNMEDKIEDELFADALKVISAIKELHNNLTGHDIFDVQAFVILLKDGIADEDFESQEVIARLEDELEYDITEIDCIEAVH